MDYTVGDPSLVLIAQVVFLLQGGHTDTQTVTDAADHATDALATGGRPASVKMRIK